MRQTPLLLDLPQCDPSAMGVPIRIEADNLIKWGTAMAIKISLAALAAVVFVAPTLSGLNGNFGSQHIRGDFAVPNAEEQAGKGKETEAKSAEGKRAEVSKQEGVQAKFAVQSSQLQFLYTYYIWMEICAERFTQFNNTKKGLKEVLKSKEADVPSEQAERVWNVTVEKFQQLEGVLKIAGDDRFYADCDENNRYIEGFLTLASQMGGPLHPLPRKKDF
jgi:hypothetical protein